MTYIDFFNVRLQKINNYGVYIKVIPRTNKSIHNYNLISTSLTYSLHVLLTATSIHPCCQNEIKYSCDLVDEAMFKDNRYLDHEKGTITHKAFNYGQLGTTHTQ